MGSLQQTVVHTLTAPSLDPDEDPNAYVLDVAVNSGNTIIAAPASNNLIKLYSATAGLQYLGTLKGHAGTVNGASFSTTNPNILVSASADSTVRVWDCRTYAAVAEFQVRGQEFNAAALNLDDTQLAAGGEAVVQIWDLGTRRQFRQYSDAHLEAVTQVRWHPATASVLVTGSVDNLVNVIDNTMPIDDAFVTVLNIEQPVARLGFAGPTCQSLYCLTGVETMNVWDLQTGVRSASFDDARERLGLAIPADYLIGAHYVPSTDALWVMTGDHEGQIGMARLDATGLQPVDTLRGGHAATVRGYAFLEQAGVIVTGGEDSRLCAWTVRTADDAAPQQPDVPAAAAAEGLVPPPMVSSFKRARKQPGRADKRAMLFWGDLARVRYRLRHRSAARGSAAGRTSQP